MRGDVVGAPKSPKVVVTQTKGFASTAVRIDIKLAFDPAALGKERSEDIYEARVFFMRHVLDQNEFEDLVAQIAAEREKLERRRGKKA